MAEEYLARKKKRLVEAEQAMVAAVEGRDPFLAEVVEGERSLTKLQEEKQMMEEVLGGPEPAHGWQWRCQQILLPRWSS